MEIKRCPCGMTPKKLIIMDANQGGKWAQVSGDCCGYWEIEFHADYHALDSKECYERAVEWWNEAPRK